METFEDIVKGLVNEVVDGVSGHCRREAVDAANTFLSRSNSKLRFDKVSWKWSEELDQADGDHGTHTTEDPDHQTHTMKNTDRGTRTEDPDHQTHTMENTDRGTPTEDPDHQTHTMENTDRGTPTAVQERRRTQTVEIPDRGTPTAMQRRRETQRLSGRVDIAHRYNFRIRKSPDKRKESIGKALKGCTGKGSTVRKHRRTCRRGAASRNTRDRMSEEATLGGDTDALAKKAQEEPSKETDLERRLFDNHGGDDVPRSEERPEDLNKNPRSEAFKATGGKAGESDQERRIRPRNTRDRMSEEATLGGDKSEKQPPFEATDALAKKAQEEPPKESDLERRLFDNQGGNDVPRSEERPEDLNKNPRSDAFKVTGGKAGEAEGKEPFKESDKERRTENKVGIEYRPKIWCEPSQREEIEHLFDEMEEILEEEEEKEKDLAAKEEAKWKQQERRIRPRNTRDRMSEEATLGGDKSEKQPPFEAPDALAKKAQEEPPKESDLERRLFDNQGGDGVPRSEERPEDLNKNPRSEAFKATDGKAGEAEGKEPFKESDKERRTENKVGIEYRPKIWCEPSQREEIEHLFDEMEEILEEEEEKEKDLAAKEEAKWKQQERRIRPRNTRDRMSEEATLGGDKSEKQPPFEATDALAKKAQEEPPKESDLERRLFDNQGGDGVPRSEERPEDLNKNSRSEAFKATDGKAGEAEGKEPFKESDKERRTFDDHGGGDETRDADLMCYEATLKRDLEEFTNNVQLHLRRIENLFNRLPRQISELGQEFKSTSVELYKIKCSDINATCLRILTLMRSITTPLMSIRDDILSLDKGKKDHMRNLLNKILGACQETRIRMHFKSMTGHELRKSKVDVTGTTTSTSASEKGHILEKDLGPKSMTKIRKMPNWEQWHFSLGDLKKFTKPIKEKDKAYIIENCFKSQTLDLTGCILKWTDVQSLEPGKDLEDGVINGYVDLLLRREIELCSIHDQQFYFFDTLLYYMGQTAVDEVQAGKPCPLGDWKEFYEQMSWDKRDVPLSNTNFALIPVCNDRHFLLLVFDIRKWELLILEPFPIDHKNFQIKAAGFVTTALNHIIRMRAPERFKSTAPQCFIPVNIPKQFNCHDCGVLVCKYMDAFTQGLNIGDIRWSQDEIDNFRYRLVKEFVLKRKCRNKFSKDSDAARRTEHVVSGEDGSEGDKNEGARKKDNGD